MLYSTRHLMVKKKMQKVQKYCFYAAPCRSISPFLWNCAAKSP